MSNIKTTSPNSTITVKDTDRDGHLFREEMVRSKAFDISEYEYEND